MRRIKTPLDKIQVKGLKPADEVLLSGVIYTARDQAHKRLTSVNNPPFDLRGAVIYYCGPTKTPKGKIIGSCGPTTSSRMDAFTPALLKKGLSGMIGKGKRSKEVVAAMKKYKAVYFLAYAGCGALMTRYIKKAATVAYKDLGPEAVMRLEVKDLPLIVGCDAKGKDIYDES